MVKEMKGLGMFLLFFLCGVAVFAQVDNGFTHKAEAKNLTVNGLKEGKWIEYESEEGIITYDSSSIASGVGSVDSTGNPVGIATHYWLKVYKADKANGVARKYSLKGALESEVPYVNDTVMGIEKQYFDNGKLSHAFAYTAHGRENGVEKEYYESGLLKSEKPIVNDTIVGIWKTYSEEGKIALETPYERGEQNGIEKYYNDSGIVDKIVPYIKGDEDGVEKTFYENGKIKIEVPYTKGQPNGTLKEYYEDGKLKSETIYKDGDEGATKYFDENGNEIK